MATHSILCYLIKDDKILLQRKSSGLIGEGKWNGPGGKMKENENPQDCAVREIMEETGVKISTPKLLGLLNFFKGKELFFISHIFVSNEFDGEPKSGREGVVNWFNFGELPFKEMWPDDKVWMPLMLQGKKFKGDFYFDENYEKLLNYKINVI